MLRLFINHSSFVSKTHYKPTKSNRRKFRSQTSDNMDRWKSRGGKSQRREEKKREDQREKESEERRCRCAKR